MQNQNHMHPHRLTRRQFLIGAAGVSTLGFVAACTPVAAPSAPAGDLPAADTGAASAPGNDTVVIGMHQELEFLNVLYTQGGNSLSASKLAQRGLLFLDADANWTGELAKEVPSVANGGVAPDGSQVTFQLREGLTWHDGEPVTSADVLATWEMIMNPDNAVVTRFGYNQISSVDTPDDYTVVLNFADPFASWPILFDAIVPKHIIEANSPGLDTSPAMREPVGFGPYRITQWVTGEYIEYEAFDGYWQGRPKIDRLIIRIFPSVDALMQAIAAKEVDIAWSMPTSFVPQIQALESDGINLIVANTANAERYVMNADANLAPIFADKTLRVALHHAIDKQAIIDNLLFGIARVGISEWTGSPWENMDLPQYEYDPQKAAEMLEGLGWRDEDGDGIREAYGVTGFEDGTRLSFTHATTSGNLQRENVQLLVQQMYRDVGVEMVIANRRTAELFGTYEQNGVWSHGEYEMGGWSHGLRVPDPEVSARYLCREIASESNRSGSQWYHYCNSEVDTLLLAQQQEFDAEKRKQMIFQVQELIHEDAYQIYLYTQTANYSVSAGLKNFVLHPFANFYWNPQEWEWA
jgi:peptide/nickel transport system substrate-binding protein